MHQPPQGRPPYQPHQPPPQRPVPGGGYAPPQPPPAGYGYAPPPPPPNAIRTPKKRGALRFVAASCVLSAWLTLVVALLFAGLSLVAGLGMSASLAASRATHMPRPQGLPDLGGADSNLGGGLFPQEPGGALGQPVAGLGGLPDVRPYVQGLCYASAAFNLVTGVVGFFLFLGLGQACYALLELEEESRRTTQWLEVIATRLGAGR